VSVRSAWEDKTRNELEIMCLWVRRWKVLKTKKPAVLRVRVRGRISGVAGLRGTRERNLLRKIGVTLRKSRKGNAKKNELDNSSVGGEPDKDHVNGKEGRKEGRRQRNVSGSKKNHLMSQRHRGGLQGLGVSAQRRKGTGGIGRS